MDFHGIFSMEFHGVISHGVGAYLRLYLINLSYQQDENFLNKMIMIIINYHKNSVPLLLLLPGLSITAVGASLL